MLILMALTASAPAPARADIYRYEDPEGTLHFTDAPTDKRFKVFMRDIKKDRKLRTAFRLPGFARNPAEFEPIITKADATDLVFMGELRPVKGVDVLLDAIARLRDAGRTVTATLVGDGPEREALQAQVARHGLGGAVHFMPAMPARQALALGRIMVVPSRTESLPYVVLESAAGGKPLITTKVGGIPEIYGPLSNTLVPPVDAAALAQAISHMLDHPDATAEIARQLRGQVQAAFSVDIMVDGVLSAYQTAIEAVRKTGRG